MKKQREKYKPITMVETNNSEARRKAMQTQRGQDQLNTYFGGRKSRRDEHGVTQGDGAGRGK